MAEAAVAPEALWTQFSSLTGTLLIPRPVAAGGIDLTHRRFTNRILAPFPVMAWKAAIRRLDELAIVVTGHAIRRIARFSPLDDTIAALKAWPPTP